MSIIEKIDKGHISVEDSFKWASKCSQLIASGVQEDEAAARRIVIHILNSWHSVPHETYSIWADITEAVGFYPYLDKNKETMHIETLSDNIRKNTFKSDFLKSTYMHREQKKLSDYILSGKNVVASAPTSFGKSLLIEEIVSSEKYHNIVIIQPTLALLDETRIKLKKYDKRYKIIVRTSQPPSEERGNLFLLTAERVMEYDELPKIDLLIIDEFYKLSLRRIDERADTLNNAFIRIVNKFNSKFYFLGPNIDDISPGFAEKYNAIFYKSDFSLVDCNVVDMTTAFSYGKTGAALDKEKCQVLYELLYDKRAEQSLVYCSSPARARRFSKGYLEFLKQKQADIINPQIPLAEWIDENVSNRWSLVEELKYGVAFHDGSLQKHIGTSIIKYFNDNLLHCIFCTSTIIEGVNTSAKNVMLFDGAKGSKDIDFFDYSNIKGRSGRLMEHYVGTIYNFVHPPQKENIIIDIPFFEQKPISDEILINLPKNDVRNEHLERYEGLIKMPNKLLEIIRKNGVSVQGQIHIYNTLMHDIQTKHCDIAWVQIPSQHSLEYILNLAEQGNLITIDHHGVDSTKQLAFFLKRYGQTKTILTIVNLLYENRINQVKPHTANKNKEKYYDEAVETAFHIYRHWFQFTVPKTIRVIDSLQKYVCQLYGKKPGSYTYYVQQLENDFVSDNLSILSEFGIPTSAIRKIDKNIPEGLSEDEAVSYIKNNKNMLTESLLPYEKEKFDYCL